MSREDRIAKVQSVLAQKSLDCYLVMDPQNICYFTGYVGYYGAQNCFIIPDKGEPTFVAAEREDKTIRNMGYRKVTSYSAFSTLRSINPIGALIKTIQKVVPPKASRLGVESSYLSSNVQNELSNALRPASLRDISSIVSEMRLKKDKDEIESIRRSVKIAEVGILTMLEEAKPGMTEIELFSRIIENMQIRAGEPIEVFGDLMSGEKILTSFSLPVVATTKRLSAGEDVIADLAPRLRGYWADVARTIHLGSMSSKEKDIYKVVKEAELGAINKVKPGAKASDIDAEVRKIISECKYVKGIKTLTGHGLGVHFHEHPDLAPWNHTKLESGMVLAIEPGIYLEDIGSIRLEDNILVTDSGSEIISFLPYEL